jgi:hypothetical protein
VIQAPAGGAPDNAGFYHAAYVLVAVLYGGYSLSLWLRARRVRARGVGADAELSR